MSIPPIFIAYFATLAFSCLDASLGFLVNVQQIPAGQIIFIRNGAVVLLTFAYLIYTTTPHAPFGPPGVRRLLWLRSLINAIDLFLAYWSFYYLTLSQFLTVFCLLPFFTGALCWLFVGERFTWTQGICCCLSIIGVGMVTAPSGLSHPATTHGDIPRAIDDHLPTSLQAKLIGVALCVPDVLLQAGEVVIVRLIKDEATTAQVLVILSFCPATTAGLYQMLSQTPSVSPKTTSGWIVFIGIIPLGLIAQYTYTWASQRTPGAQVSIAQYSGVVFGTIIQWLLYGNHPSLTAAMGMIMIILCGVYAAMHGTVQLDKQAQPGGEYIALPTTASNREEEP